MRTYLCFDFGGTYIKYAVITEEGRILSQDKYPTICDDYDAFMEQIRKVYEIHSGVSGIAVSMPGLIDVERGYAHTGGAILCLANRNVAQEISCLCDGLPVSIENDAKAAAGATERSLSSVQPWAERWWWTGRSCGAGICSQENYPMSTIIMNI